MATTRHHVAVALCALALAPGVAAALAPLRRRGAALCNVRTYGAVGDALTYDTAAIQRAINDRACGAVILPLGGIFLTGALNLTSDLEFVVDGILRGSANPDHYPLIPAFPSYGMTRDLPIPKANRFAQHQALLAGWHLNNVTVRGQGVIDGNGATWWARWYAKAQVWGRPRLVEPIFSTGIKIHGVTLKDSPFWTLHPYACKDVHIHDIIVAAPRNEVAPNTDGIDPDSCEDVLIERVIIDTGDNAMAIKSGMDLAGVRAGMPSRNITIRDSHFLSESWAIGSEMSGGVYDVLVDGCTFGDPFGRVWKAGAMIKTAPGRGGEVRNVTIRNSVFHTANRDPSGTPGMPPLSVSMVYLDPPGTGHSPYAGTPVLSDIHFENIVLNCGGACPYAGEFMGLAASPVQNLTFKNIHVAKGHFQAWRCGGVNNIKFSEMAPGGLPEACPLIEGSGQTSSLGGSSMTGRFASISTSQGIDYSWAEADQPMPAAPTHALDAPDWTWARPTPRPVVPIVAPASMPNRGVALMILAGIMGVALLVMQVVVYRRMRKTSKVCKRIEKVISEREGKEQSQQAQTKANALDFGVGAVACAYGPSLGLRKCGGSVGNSLDRMRSMSWANLFDAGDAIGKAHKLQEPLLPAALP